MNGLYKAMGIAALAATLAACDCAYVQPQTAYVYQCNTLEGVNDPQNNGSCTPVAQLTAYICEDATDPHGRYNICEVKASPIGQGKGVRLFISNSESFTGGNVNQNSFWSQSGYDVRREGQEIPVSKSYPTQPWYVYAELDGGMRTPTNKIVWRNKSNMDGNGTCGSMYLQAPTQVLASNVTCLDSRVAGVAFCRHNDMEVCVLDNQSGETVHMSLEVEERHSTVAKETLSSGQTSATKCEDLNDGDVVTISAWQGLVDGIADRVLDEPADIVGQFVFESAVTFVTLQKVTEREVQTLLINRTNGVECELAIDFTFDGVERGTSAELACVNTTSKSVALHLHELADSDVTATTHVVDVYDVAQFDLGEEGSAFEDDFDSVPSLVTGDYELYVCEKGFWDESHCRSTVFSLYVDAGGWQIVHLPDATVARDE